MPVDPNQLAQDAAFQAAGTPDKIAYLSSQDPDFAKAEPVDQVAYIQHLSPNAGLAPPGGSGGGPKKEGAPGYTQPSLGQVLTQPTDKTDQEYLGYTGPQGVAGATIHGLNNVAKNTIGAIKGAVQSLNPVASEDENALTQIPLVRGVLPIIKSAGQVPQIPQAIRDINASISPASAYGQAAEDTAEQGAGQALAGILGDAVAHSVAKTPAAVDAAVRAGIPGARFLQRAGAADLTSGMYSPEGNRIAASMRSNSAIDLPAEAHRAVPALKEAAADRGITARDFQGENGPIAGQAVIKHALDITEARAKLAIDPVRSTEVLPEQLAKTPELASQFTPEQLKKGLTINDIDAKRVELNKQLRTSNFYTRPPSAQYAIGDPLATAVQAAEQARDLVYDTATKATGVDLRPLKATESSLIKLHDVNNSTANTLSMQAAKQASATGLQKVLGAAKRTIALKANPTNAFEAGVTEPGADYNRNMQNVFKDVKSAPGSIMKNGRLLAEVPGVLTAPAGKTPPEPSRQLPLTFDPEAPGYKLTPPAGKTPPVAPTAPESTAGGPSAPTTSQNLVQRTAIGERRALAGARPKPMNATELDAAMKLRQPIHTPFDVTDGAMPTIASDPNMPEMPGRLRAAVNNGSGESNASVESLKRMAAEKAAGTQRVVVNTFSGQERPLIGPDAVDYIPKRGESVEFRGGPKDGEIISQGPQVRPYKRK